MKQRLGDVLHYYSIEGHSYLKRFFSSYRIPRLLHLSDDDILLYTANYMPLFGNKGKKILVIHDLLFRHSDFCATHIGFLIFRLQRYLYIPVSLKKADKVIAISEFTKKEIMEYYHTESKKIEVIYNYFDFGKYGDLSTVAKEESLIAGSYMLSVCSSAKHKNHITLLRAFERFCIENNQTKFVIVGALNSSTQKYFDSLDEKVRSRIVFLKHLSNKELGNVYYNAAMYVSASLFEGLGMPVVSTDCSPGGAKMLLGSNEYGLLVSRGNSKAIAESILAYFESDNMAKTYGNKARISCGRFSEEKNI